MEPECGNICQAAESSSVAGGDMEKGADAQTLSAESFENCGNFCILEEYSP